jgi:hypothetical protein
VQQAPEIARQFQIRHVPTCVLIVDNKEVGRLDGVRSRDDIEALFKQAAAPAKEKEEDYIVRRQSPEKRKGLGIFNGLAGRKSDPGDAPMTIPTNAVPASAPATSGGDPFAGRMQPIAAPTQEAPIAKPAVAEQPSAYPANPQSYSSAVSPENAAMAATVRLKVSDPSGMSFGTGTIIDTVQDEALVVTCGHIFRDSKGQGKIMVDLHETKTPVPGQLISFDLTRDIALVSIRPGKQVTAAKVASDPQKIVQGTRVFSIGCDHGADPSVRTSRVTAIDKYLGSPNYTTSGAPVEGRSGGGLFLADGTLIGVCNAADPKDDEGLYAGLGTIHWQLDKIGQTEIYQPKTEAAPANAIAAAPPRNELPRNELPVRPGAVEQPLRVASREMIIFLRDKGQPHARGEAITINNPTPQLLEMLSREAQTGGLAEAGPQPTALRALPEEPVIVRGQNR